MKRSALSAVLIMCLAGAVIPGALARSARAATKIPRSDLPGANAVEYLPESTVMVRVDNRVIRADEVRARYYLLPSAERGSTDSLARAMFLDRLVDKEVLGLTARKINPPLEVEQRAEMRRVTDRTLENGLHATMVEDSIAITEEEVAAALHQFQYDVRLRELLFEDRATAERVRRDLLRGRIGWQDAYRRYSLEPDTGDGSLGWVKRMNTSGEVAFRVFTVPAGSISEVYQDQSGFHIAQVLERRPTEPLPLPPLRRLIIRDLKAVKSAPRVARMYALARKRAAAAYDSTNLRWVARLFREDMKARRMPLGGDVIALSTQVPRFAPEDLKRVLVRDRSRTFTVSDFLEGYRAIPPMMRRKILSVEPLIFYVDAMFLGPVLVEMAKERGVDKDPRVISLIEERREKLMVERVFQDSIMNRVRVEPAEVRAYYDQHHDEFQNKQKARYALIFRHDLKGIDSVETAIKAGAKPEEIVKQDRAAGSQSSLTGELEEGSPSPYEHALLEVLKPGQFTRVGPDSDGKYLVVALLERREAGLRPFADAEPEIHDLLRSAQADDYLREFLARHRVKHRIESHPERVMAIRFTDPILD